MNAGAYTLCLYMWFNSDCTDICCTVDQVGLLWKDRVSDIAGVVVDADTQRENLYIISSHLGLI